MQEATLAVVNTFAPLSRRDEARALFERELEEWRERDEPRSARALWGLSWLEFWGGRWELAAEQGGAGTRHLDPVRARGAPGPSADRGRRRAPRAARARARAFGASARACGTAVRAPSAAAPGGARARCALEWRRARGPRVVRAGGRAGSRRSGGASRASAGGAATTSRRCSASGASTTRRESSMRGRPTRPDWAASGCSRTPSGAAACSRAPTGSLARAVSLLEQAIVQHEAAGDPYGHARALLALGIARRRDRQKAAARAALQAALGGFEQLGASTWVEKARHELGSIGGRTHESGLTAAEQRVAALVAEGRTNREVAAAALPRRADGRKPSHAHLRQARRALAHRARPPAGMTNPAKPSKVQTFLRFRFAARVVASRNAQLPRRDVPHAWPGGRTLRP